MNDCNSIIHTHGPRGDGRYWESYHLGTTLLMEQPVPQGSPSVTPPAQIGLEKGWCMANTAAVTPVPVPPPVGSSEPAPSGGVGIALAVAGTGFLMLLGTILWASYQLKPEKKEPVLLPPSKQDNLYPENPFGPFDNWVDNAQSQGHHLPEQKRTSYTKEELDLLIEDRAEARAWQMARDAERAYRDLNMSPVAPAAHTPKAPVNIGSTMFEHVQNTQEHDLNTVRTSENITPEQIVLRMPFDPLQDIDPIEFQVFSILKKQQLGLVEIILKMWNAQRGGSERYKKAHERYQQFDRQFTEAS